MSNNVAFFDPNGGVSAQSKMGARSLGILLRALNGVRRTQSCMNESHLFTAKFRLAQCTILRVRANEELACKLASATLPPEPYHSIIKWEIAYPERTLNYICKLEDITAE